MWLGLEPSQNPAWHLNPCDLDSNLVKTHSTWFQELTKLRFLMSHCRKNSVRDRVIGKKWIYSDTERSTLHRESVGHHRGRMQPWNLAWLVFVGCVISYANEWGDYSRYFWEGLEISKIWGTAQPLGLLTVPWNCHGTPGCVISLADWGLVLSAILVPFHSNWFYVVSLDYIILSNVVPCPFPSCYICGCQSSWKFRDKFREPLRGNLNLV